MRILGFFTCFFMLTVVSQAQTITGSGNWTDNTNWSPAAFVNDPTINVIMNASRSITVRGTADSGCPSGCPELLKSGSIDATAGSDAIVVNAGGQLEVGDNTEYAASHTHNIVAGSSMTITAYGTIIIWGDLIVNNDLIINIQGSGQIIIKGNLSIQDFASITVHGDLEVDGSFTGGQFTHVSVFGNVDVFGPTAVGPNSDVSGSGHFHAYGGCTGPTYPSSPAFCGNPLPVKLTHFRAEAELSSIKLQWTTASELNFDYFIVEKSSDGISFAEIGSVDGHGTTKQKNDYYLVDDQPTLGKIYYRLTEVDLDHSLTQLKIIAVDFTAEKALTIYPNPVTNGSVTLHLNFNPGSNVVVSIVDLRGVTLSEFLLNQSDVTLPVQLGSGIYLIKMQANDYRSVSRLVVK